MCWWELWKCSSEGILRQKPKAMYCSNSTTQHMISWYARKSHQISKYVILKMGAAKVIFVTLALTYHTVDSQKMFMNKWIHELLAKEPILMYQPERRMKERNGYRNSVWEPDMATGVLIWPKTEWILLLVMSSASNQLTKGPVIPPRSNRS